MTKMLFLRLALIAAICALATACKSTKAPAESTEAPAPQSFESIGADTSAPSAGTADAELDFTRHTVRKGDTFYAIARQYGASVKDVIAANPGVEPTALSIGQEVLVPVKK